MKRYFENDDLIRLEKDFAFLIKAINNSYGELDLRLRGKYFNLYYKGNSVAKVTFNKNCYGIAINKKFDKNVFNKLFKANKSTGSYHVYKINRDGNEKRMLHAFFKKKHLSGIAKNIKDVNYSEEIAFEQMLITDNRDRNDLIIIDRQITETSLKKNRLDLLVLKKTKGLKYQFVVIEVKLGNNKELREEVAGQLEKYIEHIEDSKNYSSWKKCYEKVYLQMKRLGIYKNGPTSLHITRGVKGLVLIGKYMGMAQERINQLLRKYPNLTIKPLVNKL